MKRTGLVALLAAAGLTGCGGAKNVVAPSGAGVRHSLRADKAAEISAARSSNADLFRIFPDRPGSKACAIPDGGMAAVKLRGSCRTSITYPDEHGPSQLADVGFRERWGGGSHSSSWTVIVEWPAMKVAATQLHGETSPQMRYAASDKTPGDQPALDAAASYAETVAGAAHVFAGVAVDDPADKTIVYLVHAPQSILAELRARHPGTYVIHNHAPHTLRAVMQLQQAIDWKTWQARGIEIVSTGPTETGFLRIGVSSNLAKARAALYEKYGRGIVRVVHGEPSIAAVASGSVR